MTAFVLTFGSKPFSDTELCNARLAAGNIIVISTGKQKRHGKIFEKTHELQHPKCTIS